ncbi:hypothetical protein, partial [Pectobacterium carotovorum]|uniref:hypothetical protein n=1 Tax=Pectobacterium brasiliense TaxID=180957 RepID=UPI001BE0EB01
AQKPHQKPDICLQLPILHLAEKRLVQPGASIYGESQCRVGNASPAARLAVMGTDGTAQRHNLAGSQGSQGDGN